MKKIMSAMLGLSLMLGAATLTFAQDEKDKAKAPGKSTTKKKASTDKTDKAATKKASTSKKKASTDKTDKKS